METVTLVFTRRRAIGSALLRAWMHSDFSHCALVDRVTNTIIEASAHGVRERPLDDLLNEASEFKFIDIACPVPEIALNWARQQINKPYDWFGVLGFWFRRNWDHDGAWFCSELCATAIQRAGRQLFRRKAYRVSPETLYLPVF